MHTFTYASPIGFLAITSTDDALQSISLSNKKVDQKITHPLLIKCKKELDEYFAGRLKKFSLPLAIDGTDFQVAVWQATRRVPYGTVSSYKDISRAANKPMAARAVGNACNANTLPILIPCHRVVHSDGRTTGYALGADRKQWLLDHEKKWKYTD